jgi:WD40 repeat protein
MGLRLGVQVGCARALITLSFVTARCSVIVVAPDGRILCSFKPYPASSGLGVTAVAWSPTSQFLAVGCHNSRLYVLNTLTFKPTWETSHDGPASSTVIYRFVH